MPNAKCILPFRRRPRDIPRDGVPGGERQAGDDVAHYQNVARLCETLCSTPCFWPVARRCAPISSSPRILNRQPGTVQICGSYAKAPVAVHRRSPCSGVKACPWLKQGALRNTSDARRQAAKLCYRFGPLTPSARSAKPIVGDGTKNGLPAPNKEPTTTRNNYLTGKAPYKFEIPFCSSKESAANPPPHPTAMASNRAAVATDYHAKSGFKPPPAGAGNRAAAG